LQEHRAGLSAFVSDSWTFLFKPAQQVAYCCVWSCTAKMIGLPQVFWHENGIGGGVIQVELTHKLIL